jgi:cytosine/adenosine deaminase-related metal-dependent hydrolase
MTLARHRVVAHTHLYSGLAPLGLPVPDPSPRGLPAILERVWWRLDRALDERSLAAAARLWIAEALLSGTSALIDHHESPSFVEGSLDVLADACEELGMPAVLCYGATERNGGREEARRGLAECRRFLAANQRPLVRGCVGIHAAFTVSDETLREAGALARELGTVVHVHVAEDRCDVEDALRRGHAGVLARLVACEALPPGSILAHGVHLTEREVREADERGLWLVHNPRSNAANGVGWAGALGASRRVALGTDGFPGDLDQELLALLQGARAHGEQVEQVLPRLDAGARLLAERFGSCLPALAIARGRLEIAGRTVVAEGRLASAELERVRAQARAEAPRLWSRREAA